MPKGFFGFVYLITDKSTGKRYVGKKHFKSLKKQAKSKKRKSSESDWKSYYSSNDWIKSEIKKGRAVETFQREILHLCESLGKTNYLEVKEQFARGVLETEEYLNDNISGRWYSKNVNKYF